MTTRTVLLLLASTLSITPARANEPRPRRSAIARAPAAGALCSGEYSDELAVLSPPIRARERNPLNGYSYCLRTTATYECLSYASDGSVRSARRTVVAHGTAFAYRRSGSDTLLATNHHVAKWPSVTDENHVVEDVPAGCKMINGSLSIVDDEDDGYEANDIPLASVVDDVALDVAILRAHVPLKIMPYAFGHSAALHVGNVVAIRGFPLGAFQATNLGKVVNTHDHDTSRDWDHVDFVTDALLSQGNSGSPVLAVSCKTGAYELVGIYHAGYVNGNSLQVVIGIDDASELMTTLRRSPRITEPTGDGVGAPERATLLAAVAARPLSTFFPFGNLVAVVRPAPGPDPEALLFEVYSRGFPLRDERLLVVEDLPVVDGFGEIGRVYVGNRRGLRAVRLSSLELDVQAQLGRIVARLRAGVISTVRLRALEPTSRDGVKRQRAIERYRARSVAVERDAAQALADLADRLAPKLGEAVVSYADAVAPPRPAGKEPVASLPQ